MMTLDAAQVYAGFAARLGRLSAIHLLFEEIGQYEQKKAKERITDTKESPWGGQWEPWATRTFIERDAKGNTHQGLLWDSGTLLNSIHHKTTAHGTEIGTDIEYAPDLQYGTDKMPARPFLGWDDKAVAEIEYASLTFFKGY